MFRLLGKKTIRMFLKLISDIPRSANKITQVTINFRPLVGKKRGFLVLIETYLSA